MAGHDSRRGGPEAGRDPLAARAAEASLSPEEVARYGRHLILPEVGVAGQRRLKASSVALIGAGGLGSPLGLYLAAAGVGRLGVVDFDAVDASNLQRQVLFGTDDVGRPKAEVARERLLSVNRHVDVRAHTVRLEAGNALGILGDYDVIVDGTDNFPTRYLVNDASVLLGKPNVYGSIFRFEGQVSVFGADGGPCYRCLYPEPPPPGLVPNCEEAGVLGILPGVIGAVQATETIKLLLGVGDVLRGRLLLFDALRMQFRELRLRKDPACPVCGEKPTIRELTDAASTCAADPGPGSPGVAEVTPRELSEQIDRGEAPVIVDVRTPQEWEICRLDRARLIPLQDLAERLGELDAARDIVTVCKLGQRSASAAALLHRAGFPKVRSLRGGLVAWSREIDPSLPLY